MRARGLLEALLVLVLAVVVTAVLTHPLVLKMDRVGRVNTGDGQLSIWNVAWVAHALTTQPRQLYHANIFYPHRNALAFSEPNIGAGVLAIPAWIATKNPYLAHNSAAFLAFVLSITGGYVWARYLTAHRGAAVFAALAFAFCPYIYARFAHIQLLMVGGLPWSLWACHRLVDRASPSRAVALGLILAATGLACGYYGFFAGLVVATALLFYAVTRGTWRLPGYWANGALAAAVCIASIVPFLLPFQEVKGEDFSARCAQAAEFSANWQAYLASPTYAHRWMLRFAEGHSEVLFPGILTIVLGAAGIVLAATGRLRGASDAGGHVSVTASRPRETAVLYAGIALLAIWSSFGPQASLYSTLCEHIPMFGFLRAPARLGLVVVLGLVACGALAVAHMARAWRWRAWPVAVLSGVLLAELAVPVAIPEVDPRPPRVYRALANLPRGPVAEFPFFYLRRDFHRHAYYMLQSTAHWMPLVNGYSDHIPDDFRAMVIDISSFPTRASFALLKERRARYVVFHPNFYDRRSLEKLEDRLVQYREFLRLIVKQDDLWLYEITKWPD
jgi:hypothetical protein